MKKLKLDDLCVVSFDTGDRPSDERGTVEGHQQVSFTCQRTSMAVGCGTWAYTLGMECFREEAESETVNQEEAS